MGSVGRWPKAPAKIYYGWWIVAAGMLVTWTGALYSQAFSVFFIPFKESLALSSAQTAFVLSVARLEGGLEGPIAGWLIDRFGSRRMLMAGAAIAGTGFILLGTVVSSFPALVIVYVAVISVGFNTGFFQAVLAAMNTWFIRHRTVAMSLMTTGSRVGGFVLVPLLSVIVLRWGWQTGAIAAGLVILSVVLPASLVFRRSPESMGLLPDGDPLGGQATPGEPSSVQGRRPPRGGGTVDFRLGEAVKTSSYWVLALAIAMRIVVHGAIIIHLVPIMVSKGMSQQEGANMVGLLALLGIPLTLSFGWLGDRWHKQGLLCFAMSVGTAGLVLLLVATSTAQLYAAVALLAFSESVGSLNWSLLGDFFGRRSFATLRGVISFMYSLGNFVAPVYAGWVMDRTGSYDGALLPFSVAAGLSALSYLLLRRPATPKRLARAAVP